MARGNRREPIVQDDKDRDRWVETLDEVCKMTGWEVRAYALMTNHYHVLLRTPEANLCEGMKWFQNTWTRRFNTRHREWGKLFGDRYKSILVEEGEKGSETAEYSASLIDYIHLNPGRALLEKPTQLGSYPWSSLATGYTKPPTKRPEWLDVSFGLDLLGFSDRASGRSRYLRRLRDRLEGKDDLDSESLLSGWYHGSQDFKEAMLSRFKPGNRTHAASDIGRDWHEERAEQIIREACEHFGRAEEELLEKRRGDLTRVAVAWAICRNTTMRQGWIGERTGIGTAANVSQQTRRFTGVASKELPASLREWREKIL